MVEASSERAAAVKIFLLLGQKGVYLLTFRLKTGALEHTRIAGGIQDDARQAEKLRREALLEARWAEVIGACGPLAFDLLLVGVGVATSAGGGWAVILARAPDILVGAAQCYVVYEAYSAAQAGRTAWAETSAGRAFVTTVDAVDVVLTSTHLVKSVGKFTQAAKLLQRDTVHFGRDVAEAVAWREGAKIALVHLPGLVLNSANLLASARTLTAAEVEQALRPLLFAPLPLPVLGPLADFHRLLGRYLLPASPYWGLGGFGFHFTESP
jgi:hypothetical protein